MNAYVESIRESDHFIYIENQFFITTCQSGDTRIENGIGDALVERITRAHARGERWRAVIVIPLMPGFQNTVDATDGTSVRLIMKLQYHSICRGDTSIFQRLIKEGIQPQDYINFYALRSWGRIGENKTLVTEQLYIHAKVMIVDDRIAIIGSANINERSMLGSHDSEIAAIVNDSDRIQSRMAGKDYEVSRFAHELRLRLMREHLGIDTDRPPSKQMVDVVDSAKPHRDSTGSDSGPSSQEVEEKLIQNRFEVQDSMIEAERRYHERRHSSISPGPESAVDFMPPLNLPRMNTNELGLSLISQLPPLPATDDTDIGGPPIRHGFSNATIAEAHPMLNELQLPVMTQDGIIDPLNESFYQNTWHAVAENNTKLFRLVFRCQPDNKVTKWAQYKDYNMFFERFKTGQHGILNEKDAVVAQAVEQSETIGVLPDNATEPSEKTPLPGNQESGAAARAQSKRRRRGATKGNTAHPANDGDDFLHPLEKADAEVVLEHVQGHLIEWPYDWLEKEMMSNNWDHTIDLVAPIEI
jgi:phospholipase D1/2